MPRPPPSCRNPPPGPACQPLRFAYPTNIVISAGVHFQITKRTGKTKAQLKKMARDMVYQTNENISINGND